MVLLIKARCSDCEWRVKASNEKFLKLAWDAHTQVTGHARYELRNRPNVGILHGVPSVNLGVGSGGMLTTNYTVG